MRASEAGMRGAFWTPLCFILDNVTSIPGNYLNDHLALPAAPVSFPKLGHHDNLSTLLDTLNAPLALSQDSVVIRLRHAHKLE